MRHTVSLGVGNFLQEVFLLADEVAKTSCLTAMRVQEKYPIRFRSSLESSICSYYVVRRSSAD